MKDNNNMPKYIYTLISENGDIVCRNAPTNWKSLKISLNRDVELAGVFVEFKGGALTFTGSPEKRLLRSLWKERKLLADCSLRIEYLKMGTRTYTAFTNDFKLDFDTYNDILKTKTRNAIRINTIVTGFVKKMRDRKNTVVDVTKNVSLGGYQIAALHHWDSLKKIFNISELNAYRTAISSGAESSLATIGDTDTFLIPFVANPTDFNESQDVVFAKNATFANTKAFFRDATEDRSIDVEISVTVEVTVAAVGILSLTLSLDKIDTDGTTLSTISDFGSIPNIVGIHTQTFSGTVALLTDQSMICYGTGSGIGTATLKVISSSNTLSEEEIASPALAIESLPIYETIERVAQLIFDLQFPIYSEFFGREDVAYNVDGDMYASENQERFANVINGLLIRGLALSNVNNSVAITWNKLMKTINSLWNIGLSHEIVGGLNKIIIENRASFYDDDIGMDFTTGDLKGRFNDIEIQEEALPDLAYAKIETGYNKHDYEEINGRGEYNTKQERTSVQNGENTFNNVAPIRGDTMGLVKTIKKPMEKNSVNDAFGTTDTKADSDIFIFKSQRNANQWDIETDENVQVVDDSSLFKGGSFNMFLTPRRNLDRHDYELHAGLVLEPSSLIRFQNADHSQELKTTDGVTTIVENEDITVQDMTNPLWNPEQYIVRTILYESEIETMISVRHKRIKLSETKSGWILNVDYDIVKKTAELFILKKHT